MESESLLERVKRRRQQLAYTIEEYQLIRSIWRTTQAQNRDNVSRTENYLEFYKKHHDMEWAFLASMVSRNAGWNMTDLKCEPFYQLLSKDYLNVLFHTYERPNWLIFHDAYPQLLLYATSIEWGRPLFHLLRAFDVSPFMEAEWERFWQTQDRKRLCYALIVNEQHVIEQPVIKHNYYAKKVFEQLIFKVEEIFRLNAVVFPDFNGSLYGFSVTHFKDVNSRIGLGKRLHSLLFNVQESEHIQRFGLEIKPTGSRYDYERFHQPDLSSNRQSLRVLYSVINHRRLVVNDWFKGEILSHWFESPFVKNYDVTQWYRKKRMHLGKLGTILSKF